MPDLRECAWYAGALTTHPPGSRYGGNKLEKVNDLPQLLRSLQASGQLDDGIIAAIPPDTQPDVIEKVISADGPMTKIINNSTMELHAFDSYLIEIYTEIPQIVEALRDRFGGIMVKSKSRGPGSTGTESSIQAED